jgi:hypothetical protein
MQISEKELKIKRIAGSFHKSLQPFSTDQKNCNWSSQLLFILSKCAVGSE